MIITVECPECHTSFPVDPRKVPDGGVKVRCSACSGIFFVEKPEMPAPVATPPVPVPYGGSSAAEEETPARTAAPAAPAEPEAAEAPTEDDGDNVDPWSGAGWDDPAEMGAPHPDPADPWSGGMGLHDDAAAEAAAAATAEAESDGTDDWPAGGHETGAVESADPWDEVEVEDPAVEPAPSDWVVEQSSPVEFDEPKAPVERLETIEEQVRSAAAAHETGPGHDEDRGEWDEAAVPPAAEAPVAVDDRHAGDESEAAAAVAEAAEEAVGEIGDEDAEEAVATIQEAATQEEVGDDAATGAPPSGFQFGKRDPHEKARRLARVLVSDMITYNPERHQRALEQGTLHADFEEEIRKSWAEYTDQVGRELAESTSYWFDALNEILARGEKVF